MAGAKIALSSAAGELQTDGSNNALVNVPGYAADGTVIGGGPEQGPCTFFENDPGAITGERYVRSPEVTEDFTLRIAHDHILDRETFNYTSQNTGKHTHTFTTMTASVSANGLLLNSAAITTTTTGFTFGSHAEFPCGHAAASVYAETNMSLSVNIASIAANVTIDVGLFRRGVTTAFVPTDGAYFRFNSNGITAVINRNASEVTEVLTGVSGILANENHLYQITITEREVEFWIDAVRYASIPAVSTAGQCFLGATLPWSIRQANVGAPATALQALITDYTISYGGAMYSQSWAAVGNRSLGSYQGLSGGTMGSLATLPNSTNPTAAAPSNTALTANLPGGLGGQGVVTAAVAAATDGIWGSFQVPAGTVAVQGRRLTIRGVILDLVNTGAAVATTATTLQFSLAFGHTAVSLATAETASFATATTKAPRRIALGFATWAVGAPVGAGPQGGRIAIDLGDNPIYVNSGEFVALVGKFLLGTATGSQTITFVWQPIYGWE